jgi:hypothetical protein
VLIFARSKDNYDLANIKQMEEGAEILPEAQRVEKKMMSLMTWIFHRKLMIETYRPSFCSIYKMMLL